MATENIPLVQRAEIARTFKVETDQEELLAKIEKDATILKSLNSTQRISLGLYERNKRIAQEFNKRKK